MANRIAWNEITVLECQNDLFLMDIHVNESKLSPLGFWLSSFCHTGYLSNSLDALPARSTRATDMRTETTK